MPRATLLLALVHANLGSARGLQAYSYLAAGSQDTQLSLSALVKGIASHPLGVLRVLWAKRLELWANLAPSGLAGLGDPLILPLMLVVLLSTTMLLMFLAFGAVVPAGGAGVVTGSREIAGHHRRSHRAILRRFDVGDDSVRRGFAGAWTSVSWGQAAEAPTKERVISMLLRRAVCECQLTRGGTVGLACVVCLC